MLLEQPSQPADDQEPAGGESSSRLTTLSRTPLQQIRPGVVEHPKSRTQATQSTSSLHGRSPKPVQKAAASNSQLTELANKGSMFHVQTPENDTSDLVVTANYYTGTLSNFIMQKPNSLLQQACR